MALEFFFLFSRRFVWTLTGCIWLSIIQVKSKSSPGTYRIRTVGWTRTRQFSSISTGQIVFHQIYKMECLFRVPCPIARPTTTIPPTMRTTPTTTKTTPIRRISMKIITPTLSSNNHVRRRTLSAYNIRSASTTENDKYSKSHMHTPPPYARATQTIQLPHIY